MSSITDLNNAVIKLSWGYLTRLGIYNNRIVNLRSNSFVKSCSIRSSPILKLLGSKKLPQSNVGTRIEDNLVQKASTFCNFAFLHELNYTGNYDGKHGTLTVILC